MLECVVNISEGRRADVVAAVATAGSRDVLDVHSDADHNRSVLTLVGEDAARAVARAAVDRLDLRTHSGVHPRLGVVDVVPFVPLGRATMADAVAARDRFLHWAAAELGLPCFAYGPSTPANPGGPEAADRAGETHGPDEGGGPEAADRAGETHGPGERGGPEAADRAGETHGPGEGGGGRTLPEVRRRAFRDLAPDAGPGRPHPSAGAVAVGARGLLVAWNVWLAEPDLATARRVARDIRGPHLRALGLPVAGGAQVSMNLVTPDVIGPAEAWDLVAERAEVARAELVGLVPRSTLTRTERARWEQLDLAEDRTIEHRLEAGSPAPAGTADRAGAAHRAGTADSTAASPPASPRTPRPPTGPGQPDPRPAPG